MVKVQEGTCINVMRGGQFHKSEMAWKDHVFLINKEGRQETVAKNWEVVDGEDKKHILGGIRLYTLIPGLDKIDYYRHEWAHIHADGRVVFHDEWLDSVMLKLDIYAIDIPLEEEIEKKGEETESKGAEDINGVPLGITVALPMWIYNPYIARFQVRRWYTMIATIVKTRLRQFVAEHKYKEELLPMRTAHGSGQEPTLWEDFWNLLRQDFEAEGSEGRGENIGIYGVEIVKKGAGIHRIDVSKQYLADTTKEYTAEQERKKTITDAKANAEVITIAAKARAKAAKQEAMQKATEAGGMFIGIRDILTKDKKVTSERAEQLAAAFVTYWRGTEKGAIIDWRFLGGKDGDVLAEAAAKFFAIGEVAKKKANEQQEQKSG